jgi:hypothetical protein
MILSFLSLVLAAIVGFVLLPLLFVYSGWSLFLVIAGFIVTAWLLLCYVGHAQALLFEHIRKRRHH